MGDREKERESESESESEREKVHVGSYAPSPYTSASFKINF